jgi:hypothetical protein
MGRSASPSPRAHPQHPVGIGRDRLNPHGWQSVTQGRSSASSEACSSNKRVNLIRSRSGIGHSSQTAHRLRAVR